MLQCWLHWSGRVCVLAVLMLVCLLLTGIDLVLNSRVVGVRDGHVSVVNKAGVENEIAFGACVWATGIAMNPLVKEIQQAYPESQTHFRCTWA